MNTKIPLYIEVYEVGPREWILNRVFPTTRRTERKVYRRISEAKSAAFKLSETFGGTPVTSATYRDGK